MRRRTFRLQLWCEWPYAPGPHALTDGAGVYDIGVLPAWLQDYLPFLQFLVAALGIAAPLVPPVLAAGLGAVDKALQAAAASGAQADAVDLPAAAQSPGPARHAQVPADFRALKEGLRTLDSREVWGGLSPVARPEDRSIVYLCRSHVIELEYPLRDAAAGGP
jgi:hypothetical protein